MKQVATIEFPPEQQAAFGKARRLQVLSIAYLCSAAVFLYLVMGNSQAMRASLLETLISLIPPIAFLTTSRIAIMKATGAFPYGRHRAVSIGYITAALTLLGMGLFVVIESASMLARAERPTIGGFELFGTTVWAGWPMLAALAYSGLPAVFLGRAKLRLAPVINDKVLYADAEMMRADWKAEGAAAAGVIGIGFGLWWADAAAATLVGLDIARDGARNLKAAVTDLMDETPKKTTEPNELDPLPADLARYLESFEWVERAEVRLREEGHVYFGEAFVVPRTSDDLVSRVAELAEKARAFHWRVHDLTVMPVAREALDGDGAEEAGAAAPPTVSSHRKTGGSR